MNALRTYLKENWLYWVVLVGLIVLPHAIGWVTGDSPFGVARGDRFIMRGQSTYWQSVFIEVFALGILVMSYNLMFGFTGVISFGHALFFGGGAYITGMTLEFMGLDPALGLLVGVLLTFVLCGLVGLLMGLATLRLRGVYFAIFTLAIAEMVWVFFGRFPATNGEDGLTLKSLPAFIDPTQNRLFLYYVALVAFAFTFVFIRRLVSSPTGRVFQAIRENEERAQAIGYATIRFKLFAITVASMMAGGAGILHSFLNKSARPEYLSVTHTVDALLMTIIGGVGTFVGPVIGSAGLELADVLLRDAKITLGSTVINVGESWNFLLGVVFIVVVLVFPYGVVGTWHRWRARRNSAQ